MRLILILLLIATSTPAFAQSRVDAARSALAKIDVGTNVRLRINRTTYVEGALAAASRDSLLIREDTTVERRLPIAEIDSLWARGAGSSGTPMVGGLLTGLAGAFLAQGFISWDSGRTSPSLGAFAGGFLLGAIPGALLGARIDGSNRWKLLFPVEGKR